MSCATLPCFLAPHPPASFQFCPSGQVSCGRQPGWTIHTQGQEWPLPPTALTPAPGSKRCLGEEATQKGVGAHLGPQKEICTLSSRLVLICMKLSHTETRLRNQPSPSHCILPKSDLTPSSLSTGLHLTNVLDYFQNSPPSSRLRQGTRLNPFSRPRSGATRFTVFDLPNPPLKGRA